MRAKFCSCKSISRSWPPSSRTVRRPHTVGTKALGLLITVQLSLWVLICVQLDGWENYVICFDSLGMPVVSSMPGWTYFLGSISVRADDECHNDFICS